jgi:iron complex transport system ATP-binding protein
MRVCRRLANQGTAVLAVLHDLTLAAAWADRIGVMHGGRLVAHSTPREVLHPSVISQVFGEPVVVVEHPIHGWPVVLPANGADPQPITQTQEEPQ